MRARIDNLKSRVPMMEVLSVLNVLPASADGDFQMKCPFHGKDTKPSARVYRNELFKCFACGVAYDIVSFYAHYKKVGMRDACYLLEKHFHVKWDGSDDDFKPVKADRPSASPLSREVSLSDLVRITEKQLIERKRDLGLEKYAKSFYVLDRAEEKEDLEMIKTLRSKLSLTDVFKRII